MPVLLDNAMKSGFVRIGPYAVNISGSPTAGSAGHILNSLSECGTSAYILFNVVRSDVKLYCVQRAASR